MTSTCLRRHSRIDLPPFSVHCDQSGNASTSHWETASKYCCVGFLEDTAKIKHGDWETDLFPLSSVFLHQVPLYITSNEWARMTRVERCKIFVFSFLPSVPVVTYLDLLSSSTWDVKYLYNVFWGWQHLLSYYVYTLWFSWEELPLNCTYFGSATFYITCWIWEISHAKYMQWLPSVSYASPFY